MSFSEQSRILGMTVEVGGGKRDICPLPIFMGKELKFKKRKKYAKY
jgi:hypothetical protein